MDNSRTAPRAQSRRAFPELKNTESAMPYGFSTPKQDPPVCAGANIAGLVCAKAPSRYGRPMSTSWVADAHRRQKGRVACG
jgi:hypothetical protein